MERWVLYAVISMLFAGVTSVIAKQGLEGITAEVGLAVRTCFVFAFIGIVSVATISRAHLAPLVTKNYFWLGLSGLTTAASWFFYYRALKLGQVSTIALIDKASFVVAVALAWLFLGEQITPRIAAGCALILAGLIVVSTK